jgi:hypothetical protein
MILQQLRHVSVAPAMQFFLSYHVVLAEILGPLQAAQVAVQLQQLPITMKLHHGCGLLLQPHAINLMLLMPVTSCVTLLCNAGEEAAGAR